MSIAVVWGTEESKMEPLMASSLVTNAPVVNIEELGVALTPSDLLASSSHNLYQSVFLKISKPIWPELPCESRCKIDVFEKILCWTRSNQKD